MTESIREFFTMGGHAAFIWPSYVIVFALLIIMAVLSIRRMRTAERDLAQFEEKHPRQGPGARRTGAPS